MSAPSPGLRPEGLYTDEGDSLLVGGAPLPIDAPGETLSDYLSTGDANARDLSQQQITYLRELFDRDLFLFAWVICGYEDLTIGYHGPIAQFLSLWGRTDIPGGSTNFGFKRLMLEISRDTFKTSLGTIANSLWQVSRDPTGNTTVGIFNAKESRTHAWIRTIRLIVEGNDLYQCLYRERIPIGVGYWDRDKGRSQKRGAKWNDAALEFERDRPMPEPSVSGHGATGSAAGWHFSHIIKDDIVELKHARSQVEMQAAWEWCETARYLEKPAEYGNELWNYTRWHMNDVYSRARKQWPNDYVLYHRDALEVDEAGEEHSSFPERMPTVALQREREEKPFWFHSQRMNSPRSGRETAFDPEWRRFGNVIMRDDQLVFVIEPDSHLVDASTVPNEYSPPEIPLWWCHKALLWDPAPSEEKDKNREQNARNGLIFVARDPWGRWLILEAKGIRKDPVPVLEFALTRCLYWGITQVHVEEVNFSKVYKHFAMRLMQVDPNWKRFKEAGINFIPQKAEKRHKDARIDSLKPDVATGMVYLNRTETRSYVLEENDYPHGVTRDLLDGFAMRQRDNGSFVVPRPETPDEYTERLDIQHLARARRPRGALDSVNWAS